MTTLTRLWATYGKAIAATAIAMLTAVQVAASDRHVTSLEAIQVVTALVTAVGVWWLPLHPQWAGAKTAVAALLSLLGAASTVILNGVGTGSLPEFALALLTVVFVGAAPARSTINAAPTPSSAG